MTKRREARLRRKKRDLLNFKHATKVCIDAYQGESWYKKAKIEPYWPEFFDVSLEPYEVDTVEFWVGESSKHPGRLYFIFKGSDEKKDWKYNLNPFPIPLKKVSPIFALKGLKGLISRGWAKEYTGYKAKERPILRKLLKKIPKGGKLKDQAVDFITSKEDHPGYRNLIDKIIGERKPKECWFLGHSKGGPNAAMPWAEMVCKYGDLVDMHCYQLSGPRWARISTHRDFEKLVKESSGRHFIGIIQCGLDPVPMVGPLLLAWRHTGKYYHVAGLRPTLLPAVRSNHAPHILYKYINKRLNRKAFKKV
jgi:hypothetical protein